MNRNIITLRNKLSYAGVFVVDGISFSNGFGVFAIEFWRLGFHRACVNHLLTTPPRQHARAI